MDSSTMTGSPAWSRSPGFAVTWNTIPVMWALISSGIEGSLFDHLGMHGTAAVVGMSHDSPEERNRRLDALDHAAVERFAHASDRLQPGGACSSRESRTTRRRRAGTQASPR